MYNIARKFTHPWEFCGGLLSGPHKLRFSYSGHRLDGTYFEEHWCDECGFSKITIDRNKDHTVQWHDAKG